MQSKLKVYLSGPMSGYKEFNRPLFFRTAAELRVCGYEVVCPAESDYGLDDKRPWEEFLSKDIPLLITCGGLAVMHGWEQSRGSCFEILIGRILGLQVMDAKTCLPIPDRYLAKVLMKFIIKEFASWRR